MVSRQLATKAGGLNPAFLVSSVLHVLSSWAITQSHSCMMWREESWELASITITLAIDKVQHIAELIMRASLFSVRPLLGLSGTSALAGAELLAKPKKHQA
jgi:hypothetical protein